MTFFYLANQTQYQWYPPWFDHELVAGNSGIQIITFFFCILFFWLVAKSLKAWTQKISSSSKLESNRAVFFQAMGKSLPLLGIWGGLRVGVYFISLGPAGSLAENLVVTGLEVLLVIALSFLAYYLVDVPSSWLGRQTEKTESKFDDMLVPVVRKSLRVTVYNWEISNFNGTAGNGYDKFLFGDLDFSGGNKFKIQVLPVHATLPDNNITDSGNTAGFSSDQNTFQNKSFSFLNANGTITGLTGNVNDSFEIDSRAFSYYAGHWYGDWSVSHDGSGNFALDYVVVPEPSTYAMVFSLFGFLGLKKQNRNTMSRFLAHSFSFLLRFLNGKSFPHPNTRK